MRLKEQLSSRRRYTVRATPDGVFWLLTIDERPELVTQARHRGEIELMVRDLIAVSDEVPPESFDLTLPEVDDRLIGRGRSHSQAPPMDVRMRPLQALKRWLTERRAQRLREQQALTERLTDFVNGISDRLDDSLWQSALEYAGQIEWELAIDVIRTEMRNGRLVLDPLELGELEDIEES